MVVDDDEMIVHFFKMILEEIGYHVGVAHTGSEALELAQDQRVDLALLDYKLADMTGDDLAKRLKERNDDTVIVFVTGYSEAVDRILRTNLTKHVVVKPIKDEELIKLVESALENGAATKM
jgi:DNA-binding response OmpR family regulator